MQPYDNRPIAIFDSGIGGLTVLKEVHQLLPNENIIYFGDLARIPYGTKSSEAIILYSTQAVEFLIKQNVKMIIIACNTISAIAGDVIQNICSAYSIALVNIINSIVNYIEGYAQYFESTYLQNFLILATPATINSGYYQNLLKKIGLKSIYAKPCELLVPIIEEGKLIYHDDGKINQPGNNIIQAILYEYLKDLTNSNIHHVILGCTHYPIIEFLITELLVKHKMLADNYSIINPAQEAANNTKFLLRDTLIKEKNSQLICGLLNINDYCGNIKFYITDSKARFIKIASIFLNKPCQEIEKSVELVTISTN
jgi:glutamate racemase